MYPLPEEVVVLQSKTRLLVCIPEAAYVIPFCNCWYQMNKALKFKENHLSRTTFFPQWTIMHHDEFVALQIDRSQIQPCMKSCRYASYNRLISISPPGGFVGVRIERPGGGND